MFVRQLALIALIASSSAACAVDTDDDFGQQEEDFTNFPNLQFEEDRALRLVEEACDVDIEGRDVSGSITGVKSLEYGGYRYPKGFYVVATVEGETVAGVWSTPYLNADTSECLFVR